MYEKAPRPESPLLQYTESTIQMTISHLPSTIFAQTGFFRGKMDRGKTIMNQEFKNLNCGLQGFLQLQVICIVLSFAEIGVTSYI